MLIAAGECTPLVVLVVFSPLIAEEFKGFGILSLVERSDSSKVGHADAT